MLNEIFSGKCPACSGAAAINAALCDECMSLLHPFNYFCGRCAFPLLWPGASCYRCKGKLSKRITNIYALYHYDKVVRNMILQMKFHYHIRLKYTLKQLIFLPNFITKYDGIVTVPSHFLRHFVRFYHPADILAEYAAYKLNIPILHNLKRVRYTKFQSHILRADRKENVKKAFYCKKFKSHIKNILLVDDILTTGDTINECVNELYTAGAGRIDVLVFAK